MDRVPAKCFAKWSICQIELFTPLQVPTEFKPNDTQTYEQSAGVVKTILVSDTFHDVESSFQGNIRIRNPAQSKPALSSTMIAAIPISVLAFLAATTVHAKTGIIVCKFRKNISILL
jgi:hypothetical protein